ncbi:MAG TPA: signal peptide peptidase SppA [Bacteroidota bacterium]|nr:signal peptide peptidase SppA [Bacteroidota bacterium]
MSKSTKWFIAILVVLALFAGGFILLFFTILSSVGTENETVVSGSGEKIAIVDLQGTITSSDDVVRQLKKYRGQHSIKAIVLRIDSPGGAVVPSQEMYEEVKKTRDDGKPVVVSMGSLAASGGYYVACGGSRLVANKGTLTGSIGVISEFLQVYDALAKLGIDVKTIKAGRLKDAGSPTRPMNEGDQAYFQTLMDDVHQQFISVVETERKMKRDDVVALADGRVFTGEQAVKLGLVDTLGTFEDAIHIAASMAGIKGEPAVVRERTRVGVFQSLFGDTEGAIKKLKQDLIDRPVLSFKFVEP